MTKARLSFQNLREIMKPTDNNANVSSRSLQKDYTTERNVRHPIFACWTSEMKLANLKNIFKYGSLDDKAKIAFAVVFIIFNGFYWLYYPVSYTHLTLPTNREV